MITLKYEPGGDFIRQLLEFGPTEVRVLCHKCGSELMFAPDHETAAKLKMHPGIVCPKDWRHVSITFKIKD